MQHAGLVSSAGGKLSVPPVFRFGGKESVMKRVITAAMLSLFCTSLVACHAAVDTTDDGGSHYEKKTTTNDDGTRTTKTETKKTTSSY